MNRSDMLWLNSEFIIFVVFVCFLQRNQQNFQRCSPRFNAYACDISSPFTQVGDDGILNITVNGSNIVGQESTQLSLQLNDIGL